MSDFPDPRVDVTRLEGENGDEWEAVYEKESPVGDFVHRQTGDTIPDALRLLADDLEGKL